MGVIDDSEKHKYQFGFSSMHADEMHNSDRRLQKANKTISILKDYLRDMSNLNALDIGCSTGIMTNYYAPYFKRIIGSDIDEPAVEYANKNKKNENIQFFVADAMNTGFPENSYDVIFCTQIYEHVPDAYRLVKEIKRLLKPGGICYFAAGNRLVLMEEHYNLPLLSVVPKWIAHRYLKVLGKGDFYYETHYTYWTLKKLVADFEVIDYTLEIIKQPEKFYATEMIQPGSVSQKFYLFVLGIAYWICPDYIWLLKKK